MKCPYCGKGIEKTAEKCPHCFAELPKKEEKNTKTKE